jgi:hypothetical protein
MKNPSRCSPAITPYIAVTRVRSAGVIAVNDCRTIAPMRGDPDTVKPDMVHS